MTSLKLIFSEKKNIISTNDMNVAQLVIINFKRIREQ